ncbi:MAG TPA: iron transporter [Thermoanaerobaculia bacterium]|nr:iron transporter [Thermoanaerobaculia bacterium]
MRDGADHRFVPGLDVEVTVLTADGTELGTEKLPFLWHPWLYHYGRNWQLPGDGEYTLRVRIAAPNFGRHDKENGKRYAEDVEVDFEGVEIETGRE